MSAPLTAREEASLSRARMAARLLDDAFEIPGTDRRIGIDPIVGLLPVSGDIVSAVVSLYIVAEAARCGAPRELLLRMVANVAIDTAAGSVPIAGDLFDVVWRANRRNVNLLESHLGVQRTDPQEYET